MKTDEKKHVSEVAIAIVHLIEGKHGLTGSHNAAVHIIRGTCKYILKKKDACNEINKSCNINIAGKLYSTLL